MTRAGPAERWQGPRLFTPHAAEMTALTGGDVPEEGEQEREREREALARRWAHERGVTLVLKGRQTLIAARDGNVYRNTAGTRGLGTAGSGDTLAGIAGSLLAQGLEPPAAATWAVYLHALAGEAAADALGEDGLLASDWVDQLPAVLRTLRLRTSVHTSA
jgi:NAD(P)H-hydrate epimerase